MNPVYRKENFNKLLDKFGEVGEVSAINHPIVKVEGLPNVFPTEVVLFEDGKLGQVISLSPEFCSILVFSKTPLSAGLKATRTGESLKIPVGDNLLGKSIDPLGRVVYERDFSGKYSELRSIEKTPPGIEERAKITKSLETGVASVDIMIPLGKGQRELIIGDRKTGKTLFLLQTMLNQVRKGSICIYTGIGKKKTDILYVEAFIKENNIKDKVIIVSSNSTESSGLIYITPYSAMTIAEYFKDQGKDVLIILDDLSTHSKFYRELSLINKNFPGRNSYPGDIFYAHSRLVERAGNFILNNKHTIKGGHNGEGGSKNGINGNSEGGVNSWEEEGESVNNGSSSMKGTADVSKEVSITCLPVAETEEGDISGYIQTNLMSMTDGHIYFDSDLFDQGRRPSVNYFLSVTRVGRQTQSKIRSDINRELSNFLTLYEKTQSFVHFGAELSSGSRATLDTGRKVLAFFNQKSDEILPVNLQILLFCLIWVGLWDNLTVSETEDKFLHVKKVYKSSSEVREQFEKYIASSSNFNELLGKISSDLDNIVGILGLNSNNKGVEKEDVSTRGDLGSNGN